MSKTCIDCNIKKDDNEFYIVRNKLKSVCKPCFRERVYNQVYFFKKDCVDYLGGKCSRCGYDKNIVSLQFHHLDPTKKDFAISSYRSISDKVKKELDKCIILCANCHTEEHAIYNRKIDRTRTIKSEPIEQNCKCGNNKTYGAESCQLCHINKLREHLPDKNELQKLIENTQVSDIAKIYNVAPNTIRRWCKVYDIQTPVKGYWQTIKDIPTKEILQELLLTKSMLQISKDFNVSNTTVKNWCIKYNIQKHKTL